MPILLLLFISLAASLAANEYINIPAPERSETTYQRLPGDYPQNPDTVSYADIPRGELERFTWQDSEIYPGTERSFWIYKPQQYSESQPAALLVFQDGNAFIREDRNFQAQRALDQLIHDNAIPVSIAVFIDPGQRPPLEDEGPAPPNPNLPLNRRFEYDSIDDRYARFLESEILPQVERLYSISPKPSDRAIIGNSSGGICAFNAAWHRPDLFGRVLVHNGSFVNLLGGDIYPQRVQNSEPRPLRICLTSGPYDLSNEYGDWWTANRKLAAVLREKGYPLRTFWGDNPHNPNFAASTFSENMTWLWADHPATRPQGNRLAQAFIQIPAPPSPQAYEKKPDAYSRTPDDYPKPPESTRDPNIRHGTLESLDLDVSTIYPGAKHAAWIYHPSPHHASNEYPVAIFMDGKLFAKEDSPYQTVNVLDKLIASGEIPPLVAVFIEPGQFEEDYQRPFPPPIGPRPKQPDNRRVEYDAIDDRFGRFLVEEVLPSLNANRNISNEASDRLLVGNSSGAVAAFNAAWHFPDQFGKAICHIGSFTAIRGAHHYPKIVRDSEAKPIRVFIQGGVNDQVSVFGNWWQANLEMSEALRIKGYDLRTVWGDGRHSPRHSAAIFPETLRWMWRDWSSEHP